MFHAKPFDVEDFQGLMKFQKQLAFHFPTLSVGTTLGTLKFGNPFLSDKLINHLNVHKDV